MLRQDIHGPGVIMNTICAITPAIVLQHPGTIGHEHFHTFLNVLEKGSGKPYYDSYSAVDVDQVRNCDDALHGSLAPCPCRSVELTGGIRLRCGPWQVNADFPGFLESESVTSKYPSWKPPAVKRQPQ